MKIGKNMKEVSTEAKEAMYDKLAWSEEDERMLNDILMCGEHHCYLDAGNIDWLKSLKERYAWKPSDEQIELLEVLVEDNNQRYFYPTLNSLYEQLKKLKGD